MGALAGIVSAATSGAQTGLGFSQRQQEAQAANMRGRFENDVSERNAVLAERQGADALNRGALEENRLRSVTDQQIASGRVAAAASGVDVSSGSASDVTATEQLLGNVDALTIRNNAAREAWGYDVEAASHRMQGRLAQLAGENEAAQQRASSVSTLLGGASSLYSTYAARRSSATPTPKLTVPHLSKW